MTNQNDENYLDETVMPFLAQKTAQLLDHAADELAKIKWADSEANLDSGFSQLASQKCKDAFASLAFNKNLVLLSVENPDLRLQFHLDGHLYQRDIELKSGKNRGKQDCSIPGSTFGGLDLNKWVIFCLKDNANQKCHIRYGRYYLGMNRGEYERFQDRTPRPHLTWSQYQEPNSPPIMEKVNNEEKENNWIKTFARAAVNRVLEPEKTSHSWQDDLVEEIILIAYTDERVIQKYSH